jgi:hypothetical protein
MDGDRSQNPAYRATQLNMKVLTKIVGTFSILVFFRNWKA